MLDLLLREKTVHVRFKDAQIVSAAHECHRFAKVSPDVECEVVM